MSLSKTDVTEEEMRETKSQSGQDGVAYTYEELAEYYKGARPSHQGSEVRGAGNFRNWASKGNIDIDMD